VKIVLTRIDDRLIHGQVVTVWTKETNCERIIVCNDEIDKDPIRKTLLTQVAPPGIKASVVDVEKAARVYKNPKYEGVRTLLLFTNPTDVLRMVEDGVVISSVNIGGMSFKEGKKQISTAISVDAKDVKAFKSLHEKGIELEVRKVASDSKVDLMTIL
jgi:PTS system mannose-specific IIB component